MGARTGRRGVTVLAVFAAGIAAGCASESDLEARAADAVECRELGGGWVYARYERGTEQQWRVGPDLTTIGGTGASSEGLVEGEDTDPEEERERVAARERNGWDDAAIQALLAAEADPAVEARLAQMPSCLDALRDTG
jgi:hypothetical protein